MKKELKIGIIIIVIICLLALVLTVAIQFNFKGENIKDEYIPSKEEKQSLVNDSEYSDEEIKTIIENTRNKIIKFFEEAKYFNISDISSDYSSQDNEEYMALDEEFLNNLHALVTDELYTSLTQQVELLTTLDNKIYYKAPRKLYEDLFYESAMATLNTNNQEIEPLYADNENINSIVKIQICEENEYNLCRRDDHYIFDLKKVNDDWKINSLIEKEEE